MRTKTAPTDLVRKAIMELKDADGVVTIEAVANAMGLEGKDRDTLISRFTHLNKYGEIERVSRGKYRWVKVKKPAPQCAWDRIWSVMRSRRVFTFDDVMELADVPHRMVKPMVWKLKRNGYVRRINKRPETPRFQLIKNVVERPKFDAKGNEVNYETYK